MNNFAFERTFIDGVFTIQSFVYEDNRGNFVKYFEGDIFRENGIEFDDSEDFVTTSVRNVIRGMHFQLHHPQKKLISVIKGKVYDVVIDLRVESETFGKWGGWYLTQENRTSLFIPEGCAHGFLSLSDESMVSYKCAGRYDKDSDTGIIYNDPEIAIEWPVSSDANIIISGRDMSLMSFEEFRGKCSFEYPNV